MPDLCPKAFVAFPTTCRSKLKIMCVVSIFCCFHAARKPGFCFSSTGRGCGRPGNTLDRSGRDATLFPGIVWLDPFLLHLHGNAGDKVWTIILCFAGLAIT